MSEEEKIARMNAALANYPSRFDPDYMFREGTVSSRVFISHGLRPQRYCDDLFDRTGSR